MEMVIPIEWVAEAERRGLPNLHSMVDAIPTLTTDKAVKMFEKFGVYTKEELESRVEVLYEQYSNTINIEGLATLDIAKKTDCSSSYEIPEKTCKWRC